MALSNWDTYAVGFEIVTLHRARNEVDALRKQARERQAAGANFEQVDAWFREQAAAQVEVRTLPSEGSFQTRSGVDFDIYKNWIYIRSERMWHDGTGFMEPTIAEFQEGQLRMGGVSLVAWRGPQNGIYLLVEETEYGPQDPDQPWQITRRGMIGMGIYGYDDITIPRTSKFMFAPTCYSDDCHWVGESVADRRATIPENCPQCGEKTFVEQFSPTNNDFTPWRGVKNSDIDWLEHKLALEVADEHLQRVDLRAGRRFNQGDAFIADHLGINRPDSAADNADSPLLEDIGKGLQRRLREDETADEGDE